jgi:prophage DNA circulation protein
MTELASRLASFRGKVAASRDELGETLRGWERATEVFPDEKFEKVKESVRRVARKASSLHKAWTGCEDDEALRAEITRKASENAITDIDDASKAARKALRERWNAILLAQLGPYQELARVATQFKLAGGTDLQRSLQRVEAAVTTPPLKEKEAQTLKKDLESLRAAVEGLGLAGPIGEFLKRAGEGIASPLDLFKPKIKAFFDEHPQLWGLLRVCMR